MKRLTLFGALEARLDDRVLPVPAGKPSELLICLALYEGKRLSRVALAGLLYPDHSTNHARRRLVEALHRLRRSLGERWLLVDGDSIALDRHALWVDVWEFENATAAVRGLELYGGDLAEAVDADWILSDRVRLRDRFLLNLEVECRRRLDGGDYLAVVRLAQRWVAMEPLSEEACYALMHAYSKSGCLDLALHQFERLSAELRTELGQRPSVTLSRLAEAIVSAREARRHATVDAFVEQLTTTTERPARDSRHSLRKQAHLVRASVPLGHALREQDYTDVWWTVDSGDEDALVLQQSGSVALRRHRLRRLIAEAHNQGALPTHTDLAHALHVCTRTVARDLAATRLSGTRKSK